MNKNYFSIRSKLILFSIVILLIPTLILGFTTYTISKDELTDSGKEQLKQSTDMVIGMITLLNKKVEAGELTEAEAQEALRLELFGEKNSEGKRTIIEKYASGKTGYIWAVNDKAVYVLQPYEEGKDIYDIRSEDGVMVGQEAVKIGENGGYLSYMWRNPNTDAIEEKISYVKTDPYWGWTIASGAYISEFNSGANTVVKSSAIISLIAVIIGIIVAYIFSLKFIKPINRLRKVLSQTAQGDLTGENIERSSNDEIGLLTEDFNTMKTNMKDLITQVANSTEYVASSSEQLSASAEETTKGTETITEAVQLMTNGSSAAAASLHETSVSIEEVSLAIQTLAEDSADVSDASNRVAEQAQQGNLYVEKTVQQMQSIDQKVTESEAVLQLLDSSSNEIGEISKVITDIADQTNLLALNAAIEAARAGEHGKGFAVVADEVRKLAEQSQTSSHQISELIKEIQLNMSRSTESMSQVKIEVTEGLGIVDKTEKSFQEISLATNSMHEQITGMAATVEQMSASAQEIAATVLSITEAAKSSTDEAQKVAATTEEQLAAMEEISASSDSLSKLAMELQELITKFKL